MDSILLLTKGLVATVLNRRIDNKVDIDYLIDKLVKECKIPDGTEGFGSDSDLIDALKDSIDWARSVPREYEISRAEIEGRVKMICVAAPHYSDALTHSFGDVEEADQQKIKSRILVVCSELNHWFGKQDIRKAIRKANYDLSLNDSNDVGDYLSGLISRLETLKIKVANNADDYVERLNSSDLDNVSRKFQEIKERANTNNRLKLGLIGLNDAFGGGIDRGWLFTMDALSGNGKSYNLVSAFHQIPRFNKPFMLDPSKKPLVLRITFENQIRQDYAIIYRALMEEEFGVKVDKNSIDPDEAARYVQERLSVNGYETEIVYIPSDKASIEWILQQLDYYINRGYEIHALIIDYVYLVCKNGLRYDNPTEYIELGLQRIRDYCYHRGITVFNAHQLDSYAAKLAGEGVKDVHVRAGDGGYHQYAKSMKQKVDGGICTHIYKVDGVKYMAFYVYKSREEDGVATSKQEFLYPFNDIGGIIPDYPLGECRAIYNVKSTLTKGGFDGFDDL